MIIRDALGNQFEVPDEVAADYASDVVEEQPEHVEGEPQPDPSEG